MARRHRSFIRPPKKTVMWIDNTPATAPVAVAAATSVLFSILGAGALLLRPFTILRSRGLVWMSTDQSAATEFPFGTYGEIVVTDSASAAGIVSIPASIDEPSASWFLYQPMHGAFRFADATGFADVSRVFEFDSKAMRKVGFDDDIAAVVQNGSASAGFNFNVVGRTLIQLS